MPKLNDLSELQGWILSLDDEMKEALELKDNAESFKKPGFNATV